MSAQSMREMMELDAELVYKVARIADVPLGQPNGITRREWFITHAPEVPAWFRHVSEGMPKEVERALPDPEKELALHRQNELRAWQAGEAEFDTLSPEVRAFLLRYEKIHAANEVFHAWRMKSREAKWWAWKFYFADQMMKDDHGK